MKINLNQFEHRFEVIHTRFSNTHSSTPKNRSHYS